MLYLIDRRPNARGKSAVNRERFLRRYKAQIQGAVKKMIGERRIADMEKGGDVRVPKKDISEPSFGFGRGGDREFVLPGNREYVAGDRIPRPDGSGSARGSGNEGGTGDSEDAFVFSLSREEFMQIFFDDLELPNLARTTIGRSERRKSVRAGSRSRAGASGRCRSSMRRSRLRWLSASRTKRHESSTSSRASSGAVASTPLSTNPTSATGIVYSGRSRSRAPRCFA